jgi:hypothetical protein
LPGKDNPARLKLKASKIKGVKTDGTDDVQLWLTVCDASGKAVSSTPTVDLKVISGPGEFPTGRSIRFEEGSDIRIMDGQAAISFRSYYAGKTVIEASADGLEKSRIEIEFVGDNVYREGVTPIVSYRPYVRFVREQGMSELQTFGRNNPVFAMDSLSDLSFQNLMPTFRLEAALAPKVNMHSSSTESRAALTRL